MKKFSEHEKSLLGEYPKIDLIVTISPTDCDMLEYLCNAFCMDKGELVRFLIFKQFYLYQHDEERKASQIEANEN